MSSRRGTHAANGRHSRKDAVLVDGAPTLVDGSRAASVAYGLPSSDAVADELERVNYKKGFRQAVRTTIYGLLAVAAVAVIVAVLIMPVLRIYGSSMTDTLHDGDVVLAVKGSAFETGDVVAFYYNNKILVKRVIAQSGDWVDIDDEGNVYVNQRLVDEPYVTEKALGECDIKLPYQVPEERVFVMGDHRATSVDSRSTALGCVAQEQVVGKIMLRVWPFDGFGGVQ